MSLIPIVLVTGFLGSGKTTLLRHLAESHPSLRMVFLVNEFAPRDVDGTILQATGFPTHSVIGGSLFCECKAGDFIRMLRESVLSLHRESPLDLLVIETSGMANPAAIGSILRDHGLEAHYELRQVVTVVAPRNLEKLLRDLPVAKEQIKLCDTLIVNKCDMVEPEQIEGLERQLRELNPKADVIRTTFCRTPLSFDHLSAHRPAVPLSTCEANPFSTVELDWPEGLSIFAARAWLSALPETILRVKGHIRTPEGSWQIQKTVDGLTLSPADGAGKGLVLIAHDDHEPELELARVSLNALKPRSSSKPGWALLACDVFTDELIALAGRSPPWRESRLLEMGLHDRPDQLRREMQSIIDAWDSDSAFDVIVLGYALCGNGLLGLQARRKTLVVPRAHDCISILLGGREAHEAVLRENPGTYFYSPGWIRGKRVPGPDRRSYLESEYRKKYPGDPEMVEDLIEADALAFAHHNCAAYVDVTGDGKAEAYCKNCAAFLNWKYRRLPGNNRILKALLAGEWSGEHFLTVPPGYSIQRSNDSELISAVASGSPAIP